jgi:hypothetical protein
VLNLEFWRSHAQSYGLWRTLNCLGHRAGNHVVPHATLVCVYITLQDADRQFLKVPEGFTGRFLAEDERQALATTGEYEISKEFLSGAKERRRVLCTFARKPRCRLRVVFANANGCE